MKIKTYGISELTEWHGKLKAGTIEVNVSFVGGTASPSGAQPAYMVTKDPITQFVIENSKEFKNGFIKLVMKQELPGEHPRMATPKLVADSEELPVAQAEESDTETVEDEQRQENIGKVEVADRNDAIEYLKEHFPERGYTATQLMTKTVFEAACMECGVEFVFTY